MAVLLLSNQAAFNSTDHLAAAWLHCMPMIACWTIRWRHKIYEASMLERLTWNLIEVSDQFSLFSLDFLLEIIYPIFYWSIWATFYVAIFFVYFKDYIQNPKYESAYHDFALW